jgi:hypothetical protein
LCYLVLTFKNLHNQFQLPEIPRKTSGFNIFHTLPKSTWLQFLVLRSASSKVFFDVLRTLPWESWPIRSGANSLSLCTLGVLLFHFGDIKKRSLSRSFLLRSRSRITIIPINTFCGALCRNYSTISMQTLCFGRFGLGARVELFKRLELLCLMSEFSCVRRSRNSLRDYYGFWILSNNWVFRVWRQWCKIC